MIRDVNDNKKKKVDEILSIVKVSSLLFSAMAFLQYTFNLTKYNNKFLAYYSILSILISIFLLSTIYILWRLASLNTYKDHINKRQLIEILLFMNIFIFSN